MVRIAHIAVVSVFLFGPIFAVVADSAHAKDDRDRGDLARILVGLWEGVDIQDGSTLHLSIADHDGDRVLEFLYTESFFSLCFDDDNTKGRGFFTGTVKIRNDEKFRLITDGIVCINDDNTQDPELVPVTPKFRYSRKNDILIDQDVLGTQDNFLHRTSVPARGH